MLNENRAFWAWVTVEFLRHTGVPNRRDDGGKPSQRRSKPPSVTGEMVPLLQIAPSKTDEERLLLAGPELADVLSTIISRVRGTSGIIPLDRSYDAMERVWNPSMPLLFQ